MASTDIRYNFDQRTNGYLNGSVVNYDGTLPPDGAVLFYDQPSNSWSFQSVMTNGDQTFSGVRTFTGTLQVGGGQTLSRLNAAHNPTTTVSANSTKTEAVDFDPDFAVEPRVITLGHIPGARSDVVPSTLSTTVASTTTVLRTTAAQVDVHSDYIAFI